MAETRFTLWCPRAPAGSVSDEGRPLARPSVAAGGASGGPSAAQTRASAGWWWDGQRERRADWAGLVPCGAAVSTRGGVGAGGYLLPPRVAGEGLGVAARGRGSGY